MKANEKVLICGQRVKNLRRALRISQRELAYAVGVTQPYISSIEIDAQQRVGIKIVHSIARVLHVASPVLGTEMTDRKFGMILMGKTVKQLDAECQMALWELALLLPRATEEESTP